MFYCATCADSRKWPRTMFQSFGYCEVCGEQASCNEKSSRDLPPPK
jgi:hypothetical protein